MSMFFCADCDELRDADDGCDEASPGSLDLICVECMELREDDAPEAASDFPPPSALPPQSPGDKARDDHNPKADGEQD